VSARGAPRIGVSVGHIHADPNRKLFKGKELQFVEEKMAASVWRGGGLPLVLPDLRSDDAIAACLDAVDGILLQGGADVAPSSYGQVPRQAAWAGDPLRDHYEIALTKAALVAGLPVLGICRGIQVLNVALGGTLLQDIESQHPDALSHRDWPRYEIVEHTVALAPNSWLREVYEDAEILVNTIHHQAVDAPAAGFEVTARAPDGIVEAIESRSAERWAVGVQWHPEWLDGSSEGGPHRAPGTPLFAAFSEVCRQRSRRG